jgi:hypothetical protein
LRYGVRLLRPRRHPGPEGIAGYRLRAHALSGGEDLEVLDFLILKQ